MDSEIPRAEVPVQSVPQRRRGSQSSRGVPIAMARQGHSRLSIASFVAGSAAAILIWGSYLINIVATPLIWIAAILAFASVALAVIALVRSDKRRQRLLLPVLGIALSIFALATGFIIFIFIIVSGFASLSG